MTNNEAIAQLQDVKNRYEEYLTDEACDMAIEALEKKQTFIIKPMDFFNGEQ